MGCVLADALRVGDPHRQRRLVSVLVPAADWSYSIRADRRDQGARPVARTSGGGSMRVVAYFDSLEARSIASSEADQAGWRTVGVCSPAFNEQLLDVARATRSPVAISAVIGGIVGLVSGLLLTVW